MSKPFTWIPIYQELATELAKWQVRQAELIQFLEDLRKKDYVITPLTDKDKDGALFLYEEIDPFTFFGVFNRGIRQDQRVSILVEVKKFFNLMSEIPTDFDGIPVLNNMKSIFFSRKYERDEPDVARLWRVFSIALEEHPLENEDFLKAFDEAMKVKSTNINLTMALFWIRPYTFLNLDQLNRLYFDIKLPAAGLSAKFYKDTLRKLRTQGKTYPELSLLAWEKYRDPQTIKNKPLEKDVDYWLVGANWNDHDPPNQTSRQRTIVPTVC